MSKPDTPTRQQVREIAREEAQSVYDDLTVVDHDGNETTLSNIETRVNALAPDLSRRESLKIAIVAFGYVATGAAVSSAILNAMTGTASADAQGQVGTSSDPLTAVFTDDLEFDTETPQDVTASRSDDTQETNNTNYPLAVYAFNTNSGAGNRASAIAKVSGSTVTRSTVTAHDANTVAAGVSFIVPPGDTYAINFIPDTGFTWFESKVGSP